MDAIRPAVDMLAICAPCCGFQEAPWVETIHSNPGTGALALPDNPGAGITAAATVIAANPESTVLRSIFVSEELIIGLSLADAYLLRSKDWLQTGIFYRSLSKRIRKQHEQLLPMQPGSGFVIYRKV